MLNLVGHRFGVKNPPANNHPLANPADVAGVDYLTFPDVFVTGDGGQVTANGAIADTPLQFNYLAPGTADLAGNPTLTATDRAGNVSAPTLFTVLWDALAPTMGALNLTLQAFQGQLQQLYKANATTLYYGFDPKGRVQVQSVITDGGAGVKKVTFPAMLGQLVFDVTEPNGGNTYGRRVDVVAATGEGLMTVTAYDQVGNSSAQTFLLYQDVLSPTVHLTVTQATDDFEVSWNLSDPALDGGVPGSGLAT